MKGGPVENAGGLFRGGGPPLATSVPFDEVTVRSSWKYYDVMPAPWVVKIRYLPNKEGTPENLTMENAHPIKCSKP